MDCADVLRQKCAIILQSCYEDITRDEDIWIDTVQKLALKVSSSDIVSRNDLCYVLDSLKNPASFLYLQALEIVMRTFS